MNSGPIDLLIAEIEGKLLKALARFESSFSRLPAIKDNVDLFTDEQLGVYDEFMSRFARLTDIFLSRYLRACVKRADPAFRGSFRDTLDVGEKLGVIDSASEWYRIRELRNRHAHEYEDEDLLDLFRQTLAQTDRILSIKKTLSHAS
ncbi:hypothetical protein WDW86_01170 [Bdellovibrionota bacterium FG-2]